jgi:hypothetical protein
MTMHQNKLARLPNKFSRGVVHYLGGRPGACIIKLITAVIYGIS